MIVVALALALALTMPCRETRTGEPPVIKVVSERMHREGGVCLSLSVSARSVAMWSCWQQSRDWGDRRGNENDLWSQMLFDEV